MIDAFVVMVALASGLLIGLIGIGGVLLVPLLTIGGIPVHVAVAASMLGYVFSGVVGTIIYTRKGSIAWPNVGRIAFGAAPGAFVGACLARWMRPTFLLILIALTALISGIRYFTAPLGSSEASGDATMRAPGVLPAVGLIVGLASALTGTGGPLLLVPTLLWLQLPVLVVVGLSQVIQVPIAISATLGNLYSGEFHPGLGLLLAIGLTAGSAIGARLAHSVSQTFLAQIVAVVLLVVAGVILIRLGSIEFA